ncbi:MAG TPA: DNA-3-methyladenine glycosylase, partial [Phycisphaerales bacterium]|nr:DNA-3-methyladenine glycosylase [Phycisphaerales bacterium]
TEGLETMRRLRGPGHPDRDLCRGPGRLCQALAIGPPLNAVDMTTSDALWIEKGVLRPGERPAKSGRIGMGEHGVWTRRALRFYLKGSPFVSGGGKAKGGRG